MARTRTTFAGYELEDAVATSTTSTVYRARDLRLGRRVALKVIAPELAADPLMRERLNRELTLAASLDHPNVAPIYEASEHDGMLYVARRWVEGADLAEVTRREHPMAVERAVALIEQVAAALEVAHDHGLVHRDVKPSNVLVAPDDHVYLIDFGLARRASDPAGLTATSDLIRALDHLAPEQIEGRDVDRRADVYALGCLLFETLTGEVPYPRDEQAAKLMAHLSADTPSMRALRPDVPAALDRVVGAAMAKDRDKRLPSAAAFAHALRDGLAAAPEPDAAHEPRSAAGHRPERHDDHERQPAHEPRPAQVEDALADAHEPQPDHAPWPAQVEDTLAGDGEHDGPFAPPVPGGRVGEAPGYAVYRAGRRRRRRADREPTPASVARPLVAGARSSTAVQRARRRWWRLPAVLVLVAALIAAPVALRRALRQHGAGLETIHVARATDALASLGSTVWVASARAGSVIGIADRSPTATRRVVDLGGIHPDRLAAGASALVAAGDGQLVTVSPGRGTPGARVALGAPAAGLATLDGRTTWVALAGQPALLRVTDGQSLRVPLPAPAAAVALGRRILWVAIPQAGEVLRLDAATGARRGGVARVGGTPTALAVNTTSVWVADARRGVVVRLNSSTGRISGPPTPVSGRPVALAADDRDVWVARRGANAATRLDARTGRPLDEVGVARSPVAVTLTPDAAWVAGADGDATRIPRF